MPAAARLARAITPFFGRKAELDQVTRLVTVEPLVTLVGAGGVGKTRLATEVARGVSDHFADGVVTVHLAGLFDAAQLPAAVAAAFDVQLDSAGLGVEALVSALGRRQALILMDNCEHLRDAVRQLAGRITAGCDDIAILATSREALGTYGEVIVSVRPFDVPAEDATPDGLAQAPAVALFLDRAARASAALEPGDNPVVMAAEVARRTGGLPLAIEMAAAQLDVIPPATLLTRLAGPLDVLRTGRDGNDRHDSMTACIEWGYRLLDVDEQRAYRLLSVLPAPFTEDTAHAIAGSGATRLLHGLVRRSFLAPARTGADGRDRFEFLFVLRMFAADLRQVHGESESAARAATEWYCVTAEHMAAQLQDVSTEPRAMAWFTAEQDNLRFSLDWLMESDPVAALRLAVAMGAWWTLQGRLREGRARIVQAMNVSGVPNPDADVRLGWLALFSSDYEACRAHCDAVIADPATATSTVLVDALNCRAGADLNSGARLPALDAAHRALDLAQALGYSNGASFAHVVLATAAIYNDEHDEALAQALAAFDTPTVVSAEVDRWRRDLLGVVQLSLGKLSESERTFRELVDLCRLADDRLREASAHLSLGAIATRVGRTEEARTELAIALGIYADAHEPLKLADVLDAVADLVASGQSARAAELRNASAVLLQTIEPHTEPDSHDSSPAAAATAARPADPRGHAGLPRSREAIFDSAVKLADASLARRPSPDLHARLTARERELLGHLAEGLTDAQIAARLFISVRTVRSHLDRIRDKTGYRRRAELTRLSLNARP